MSLDRRHAMKLSGAGIAALSIAPGRAAASSETEPDIAEAASGYFRALGYKALPPLSLITDSDFNGGLRFDPTRRDFDPKGQFVIQRLARVADAGNRDRPGVLASFTVIGLQGRVQDKPGDLLLHVLDFLTAHRALGSARMQFVSTASVFPLLETVGTVADGNRIERSVADARQTADGAGVYAPEGHPFGVDITTVGIFYPVADGAVGPQPDHAPEGTVKIAEIGVGPAREGLSPVEYGLIGIERLALAEGRPLPDFEQTRLDLLRALEREAEERGKPLPPGYSAFA